MTDTPETVCIIVNYNSAHLALKAVESALDQLIAQNGHIVIIDNASPKEDPDVLSEAIQAKGWGKYVSFVASDMNGGYGAGNNQGFQFVRAQGWSPKYLFLLNPDTQLMPGAFTELCRILEHDPTAGAVGSRLEAEDGTVHTSAFRFPTAWREFVTASAFRPLSSTFSNAVIAPSPQRETHETDWVAGASVLIRTQVFEELEGFDETFFLYYEEVDLMLRLKANGWKTLYHPASKVVHIEGQSTGLSQGKSKEKKVPRYWFESWQHYYKKNHGSFYATTAGLSRMLGQVFCLIHNGVRFKGRSRQDFQNIYETLRFCIVSRH